MGLLKFRWEEKGENRGTIKGLESGYRLAQSPGLAMRFSGLLCCRLWRGFAHRFASQGNLMGPILFLAVYLPIFSPARRLDPRRLFSRREGY